MEYYFHSIKKTLSSAKQQPSSVAQIQCRPGPVKSAVIGLDSQTVQNQL